MPKDHDEIAERLLAEIKDARAAALDMPTQEEANESVQRTVADFLRREFPPADAPARDQPELPV